MYKKVSKTEEIMSKLPDNSNPERLLKIIIEMNKTLEDQKYSHKRIIQDQDFYYRA